ncbi:hypothetical protein [Lewinella cohaerens]|uniref:hypothetical protein n=1 Tax=Lewinella cohaerens TaxID=70995 RepID=UPI00035E5399|nr:hypothetical protein [Lewinella cohaerens]
MKRLEISRTNFELAISYRWRNPIAYFLIFFCLFWDGFLVMWYGIGLSTGGEMPAMFFLFPLIHVAVGVGLTYYTICLFVNKTLIRADQRTLSVKHTPLPWPRGNKEIKVRDLQQLFVREKTGNKGHKYHVLSAQLMDGKSVTLLPNVSSTPEELLHLERSIEDYLGIPDQPVIGEITGHTKVSGVLPGSRRRSPNLAPGFSGRVGVEVAEVGDFITYGSRTFEVSHLSIHQWNDGNTDRQLQLAAVDGQHALLYIIQDKGLFNLFLEVEFTKAQQLALDFDTTPTPAEITYQRVDYELYTQDVGQQFLSGQTEGISASQWIYRTARGDEQLRILDHRGMQTVYFGQKEISAAFEVLKP